MRAIVNDTKNIAELMQMFPSAEMPLEGDRAVSALDSRRRAPMPTCTGGRVGSPLR